MNKKKIERDRDFKKKQRENLQKSFEMLSIKEKLQYIDKTNISEGLYFKKYTNKQRIEAKQKAEILLAKGNERRIHRELWEKKRFLSF